MRRKSVISIYRVAWIVEACSLGNSFVGLHPLKSLVNPAKL